ncbi:MAG: MFS transporter [Bdellovibrionales bacterium]|nr:MFS transporter [Bdellovibrionales bacterium]
MSKRQLLYFLSGQLGVMLLARFFFQWIVSFSTQTDGGSESLFSAALVGLVLLGFRLFDGITDPIAGAVSDSWVSKGKERRRLLWYWFVIPAIGLFLCFLPTQAMSVAVRWGVLLVGMLLFFLGYTFYAIPYWSLIGDYSLGEESNRRQLSNLLGLGLMVATAIGFVVSPFLVQYLGFVASATLFAVVGSVLMILPYYAQPEGLSHSIVEQKHAVSLKTLIRDLIEVLKHRDFVALLMIYGGSQMSLTVMTAASPFIAQSLLGGTTADVARLMGPLLALSIPSFWLVPYFSKRLGWERVSLVAALMLAIVYGLSAFVGFGIIGSPMTTAMIIFGLAGPGVAILLGVEGEAITTCAERTGSNQVSMYFGVYNFIVKALNGVAIAVTGIFADLSSGGLGTWAVRAMPFFAGGSLVVGVILYWRLRMKALRQ